MLTQMDDNCLVCLVLILAKTPPASNQLVIGILSKIFYDHCVLARGCSRVLACFTRGTPVLRDLYTFFLFTAQKQQHPFIQLNSS